MQSATAAFEAAIARGAVTWTKPQVKADWLNDGYGSGSLRYLIDLFDRTEVETWGSAPLRRVKAWSRSGGDAVDVAVADGSASIVISAVNDPRHMTIDLESAEQTARARFKLGVVPTGASIQYGVVLRFVDSDNHYRAMLTVGTDSSLTLDLITVKGGVVATAATSTLTLEHSTTAWFHIMANVASGGNARAMAWIEGAPIPAEWGVSAAEDASLTAGTSVGVCVKSSTGNTNVDPVIYCGDFRAFNGGIDDLSDLAGAVSIDYSLDDGLPASVTFADDSGPSVLEFMVAAPDGGPASRFFSPYRTDSPLFGLDRAVAPMVIDVGVITDDGPEVIRLATGQMVGIPIGSSEATVQMLSQTRLKLAGRVQPLPLAGDGTAGGTVSGYYIGANATWLMSWAAAMCGVNASPPPRAGCVFWAPMHGSGWPFSPAIQVDSDDTPSRVDRVISTPFSGAGP